MKELYPHQTNYHSLSRVFENHVTPAFFTISILFLLLCASLRLIADNISTESIESLFFISRFCFYLMIVTSAWFLMTRNSEAIKASLKPWMIISPIFVLPIFIFGLNSERTTIFQPYELSKQLQILVAATFCFLSLVTIISLVTQRTLIKPKITTSLPAGSVAVLSIIYILNCLAGSNVSFYTGVGIGVTQATIGSVFNILLVSLIFTQAKRLAGQIEQNFSLKELILLFFMLLGSILIYQPFIDGLRILGFGIILCGIVLLQRLTLNALLLQLRQDSIKDLFFSGALNLTPLFYVLSLFRQVFISDFLIFDLLVFLPSILFGLLPDVREKSLNTTNSKILSLALSVIFISVFTILILAWRGSHVGDAAYYLFFSTKSILLSGSFFALSIGLFSVWILQILPNESVEISEKLNAVSVWQREKIEPDEGDRPWPILIWVSVITLVSWGTIYFILYGGTGQTAGGDNRSVSESQVVQKIDGGQIFSTNCAACHQQTGMGLAGAFPPLAESEWVLKNPRVPVKILLGGLSGPIEVKGNTYNGVMPPFNKLSDEEIAAVVSYIRRSWNNNQSEIDSNSVTELRKEFVSRGKPWTPAELKEMIN